MNELLELYEQHANLALEIGHNSVVDWNVRIYDKTGTTLKDAPLVVETNDCNYQLALAKAYVDLCEYLSETRGGY